MRPLIRTLAVVSAAFALMAFTHTEPQYTIEFPDGWEAAPIDAQGLVTAKPKGTDDGANCNSQFVDRPQLAPFTQDQINAQFGTPMTAEGWGGFLAMDPANIQVSDAAAIDIGGKFMQVATIVLNAEGQSITARMGFIAMTGKILNAGCYVKTPGYEGYKDLFDATVKSLKPV